MSIEEKIISLINSRDKEVRKRRVIKVDAVVLGACALGGLAAFGLGLSNINDAANIMIPASGMFLGGVASGVASTFGVKNVNNHHKKTKTINSLNQEIASSIEKKYYEIEREQSADYAYESLEKVEDDYTSLLTKPYETTLKIMNVHLDCLRKKRDELIKAKVLKKAEIKRIEIETSDALDLNEKYESYQRQLIQNTGN